MGGISADTMSTTSTEPNEPWPESVEAMYRRQLAHRRRRLGAAHIGSIRSMEELCKALEQQNKLQDAEDMYWEMVDMVAEAFGREHRNTIAIMNRVALVLGKQGKHARAANLLALTSASMTWALGESHAATLSTMTLHALSLGRIGEHVQAEKIQRQVLASGKSTLGEDHPEVVQSLVHLASSLVASGQDEEAEKCLRQLLHLQQESQHAEHVDMYRLLNDLGVVLGRQGRHAESESAHRQALRRLQDTPDAEQLATLATKTLISNSLADQLKYEEAEDLLKQTLTEAESVLGGNHPWLPDCCVEFARILHIQGKHAEEEQLLRRAVQLLEQLHGREYPLTLIVLSMQAKSASLQNRHADAEEIHREVLWVREEVLGEESLATIESMDSLGLTLSDLGKYREAGEIHRRAMDIKGRVLGPEHASTLESISNFGSMLVYQGRQAHAALLHRQVHQVREKRLGGEHFSTLDSLNELAAALLQLGEYAEAEQSFRHISEVVERQLGSEHVRTSHALAQLGLILNMQAKYDEGLPMLRHAIAGLQEGLGKDHPLTARSMHHLALAMQNREEYAEAEDIHRQVVEIQEKVSGNDHPSTLDSKSSLALVLAAQGRLEEAQMILAPASRALEAALGGDNPVTVQRMNELGMVLEQMELENEAHHVYRRTFALGSQLPDQQEQFLTEKSNRLCAKCVHVTVRPLFTDGTQQDGSEGHRGMRHHTGMAQLLRSAKKCPLCQMILDAVSVLKEDEGIEDYEVHGFTVWLSGIVGLDGRNLQPLGIHVRSVSCIARGKDHDVLYFNARLTGPENEITTRAIYRKDLAPSALIDNRLGLIRSWLRDCQEGHPKCSPTTSERQHARPTRLIDLGLQQGAGNPRPRLIDTADLDPSSPVEYTALSHCWGPRPCTAAMTIRSNEASNRKEIALTSLPRTYRDAIKVTVTLGIRFIWIDSLCIIQGDRDDWSAEAATMSSVYQGCTVVLAAASSSDGHGGCFLDSFRQAKQCTYLSKGEEVPVEIWQDERRRRFTPLGTRGWTLQETLLARRIVYLAEDQFYWQCQTHTHSEDGVIRNSTDYRLHQDACTQPLDYDSQMVSRDHWGAWITDYTSRQLSHASDYMAAFAGITQFFADRTKTGALPALGLWTDSMFALDLGWSAHDLVGLYTSDQKTSQAVTPKRSVLSNVPSWSWFRYQMPIYGHLFSGSHVLPMTRVVSFDAEWSGRPMTSDLLSSRLIVEGVMKVLQLFPQAAPRRGQFCSFTEPHLSCFLDEDAPLLVKNKDGFVRAPCLLLSMQPHQLFATFMVLEEVGPELQLSATRRYRRIGLSHFGNSLVSLHPFMNGERAELELV